MSNFANIGVADMALAVTSTTPQAALWRLCHCAQHTSNRPFLDQVRWEATGTPVRHALLLEWLSKEMRDAT